MVMRKSAASFVDAITKIQSWRLPKASDTAGMEVLVVFGNDDFLFCGYAVSPEIHG